MYDSSPAKLQKSQRIVVVPSGHWALLGSGSTLELLAAPSASRAS